MLRFGLSSLALLLALAMTATAQAGALDLLTPDGIRDDLEDDDWESLVDMDGNGTDVGDVFIGVFRLQAINGTDLADVPGVGGVKGLIVAAIDTFDATTGYMTFRAITTGGGSEYASLIAGNAGTGGTALTNLPSISAGAALIVYETNDAQLAANTATVSNATTLAGRYSAINTLIDDAKGATGSPAGGALAMELGFTDDAFAEAVLTPAGLTFRLALNVISSSVGIYLADISTAESGVTRLDGFDLPATKIHVEGTGSFVKPGPVGNPNRSPFDLRTDANMFVNAYPEPSSMALLAMGAVGLFGARLRRRNAA